MAFFREEQLEILDWMPKGCDLSIIENVWGFCKDISYQCCKEIKNKDAVYRIGREAFFNVEATALIQKLNSSVKSRVTKKKRIES